VSTCAARFRLGLVTTAIEVLRPLAERQLDVCERGLHVETIAATGERATRVAYLMALEHEPHCEVVSVGTHGSARDQPRNM